ncbi:M16 family metallopeptidase [Pseudomarimonas salicorniae]|uniref:Insulinase family protein n=1 Tax=Pseudomarimonas salicorniae TaxID=2933270 RepID=A0ABT0GCZ9_9GAMM|nr:pitrilysin family protein [Lysobacter sp. CAU 1642]MCK7592416.1 insulinase family protein [Lysobacter sp. CAU 1642]
MRSLHAILLVLLAFGAARAAEVPDPDDLRIAHERFTLDNGLEVVVHSDHSVPIVAVNVWYKVGSRDEQAGRTGFAHLFEHFFFNGSENHPHGFREAMDDLGANNRNGTTNTDRTNFFEDVPVSALERTLYLEADRMGFLAGHISQEMLTREQGVVQNEKRQRENQPYGQVFNRLVEQMYPAGHPYSWSTIGRMEDLKAATLDDVRDWYRAWYGPNNAVLALAGDITVERARALVEKYFGAIPPGAPVTRLDAQVPRLSSPILDRMQDRVPQSRLYMAWHMPPLGSAAVHDMELFAGVLSGSDSAPLDRRLVFETQLATQVGAFVWDKQLSSTLIVTATLAKGADPAALEREVQAVLAASLEKLPAKAELDRARTRLLAGFARGSERLGGFGGRSDVLAEGLALQGDSEAYLSRLRDLAGRSAEQIRQSAFSVLDQPHYQLWVEPFPELKAGAEQIDRSVLPALDAPPEVRFPEIQRFALDNGLRVMLMERQGVPLVQMALTVNGGYASDPAEAPGTAQLALDLLPKGSKDSDAFAIADRRDALGATLGVGSSLNLSFVSMTALKANLDPSLDLLAEVVREPAFPEDMVGLQRKQQLAAIAQQAANPFGAAQRRVPVLVYGAGHPYGRPAGGLGEAAAVEGLDREALQSWHAAHFVPGNATLVVAGAISESELRPLLQRHFGDWRGARPEGSPLPPLQVAPAGELLLVDKPGAAQSVIVAAQPSASGEIDPLALETVMRNFGGMATSRLNRNLRLDKHWSYGSSGYISDARGAPGAFVVIAPVQTDKTGPAMQEVHAEIRGLAGERPLEGEELESILRSQVSRLPGRFETLSSLVSAAIDLLQNDREPDYYYDYASNLRGLDGAALNAAAAAAVDPEGLRWIVIGDAARIEAELKALPFIKAVRRE